LKGSQAEKFQLRLALPPFSGPINSPPGKESLRHIVFFCAKIPAFCRQKNSGPGRGSAPPEVFALPQGLPVPPRGFFGPAAKMAPPPSFVLLKFPARRKGPRTEKGPPCPPPRPRPRPSPPEKARLIARPTMNSAPGWDVFPVVGLMPLDFLKSHRCSARRR